MAKFPWKQVHFIGVGGVGMSGLATILLDRGVAVSGSDEAPSAAGRRLAARGAAIFLGHAEANLPENAGLVVFSSAVQDENPELAAARARGIRTVRRGDFLAELAGYFDTVVSIAGSHGKTTITAMLAHILREAGRRPGFMVGGEIDGWPAPAAAGNGRVLVTEVDESDGTQALMQSSIAVVVTLDDDHCWSLGGVAALEKCFADFANRAGRLVAWDAPGIRRVLGGHANAVFLGAADIDPELRPACAGEHNRLNATLAMRVALELGVDRATALAALASYPGVSRRLSLRYSSPDGRLKVVEDYAHHPEELRCCLQALRTPQTRLIAVFQPHRFERVKRYAADFGRELSKADRAVVFRPFAAWLQDAEVADPREVAQAISGIPAEYWDAGLEELADRLATDLRSSQEAATVAVIGAGDIGALAGLLRQRLARATNEELAALLRRDLPGIEVLTAKPWRELTSLGVGAACPLLARPRDAAELAAAIRLARAAGFRTRALGAGTNLVGSDTEMNTLFVQLHGGEFRDLRVEAGRVRVGATVPMWQLGRELANHNLLQPEQAGLGWVPGSVGGAVRMNAGAHGAEMCGLVEAVHGVDAEGCPWERRGNQICWEYRHTDIPEEVIITGVECRGVPGDGAAAAARAAEIGELRKQRQPAGRSAGSVFRNAGTTPAGLLLDKCGMKGTAQGAFRVSAEHANFIVNEAPEKARENDFADLVRRCQWRVFERTGVRLQPEVVFVNPATAEQVAGALPPLRLAVLKGGPSREREVSLRSGAAVAKALREGGHLVYEIDVTGAALPELPARLDAVFPALHGEFGEDGGAQELLAARGLAFVGSGPAASRLIMDKVASKEALLAAGLPTPAWRLLTDAKAPLPAELRFPLIVKPNSQGSSLGMTKLQKPAKLSWSRALHRALALDTAALAEEFVTGIEATVGVLHGEPLPVIEIVPPGGRLFDFDAKYEYKRGHTQYFCPPERLNEKVQAELRELAAAAFRALGARDMLRVDFIVDANGRPWILEGNSIPGFTATSLLPKAAGKAGISFPELCCGLVAAALRREEKA